MLVVSPSRDKLSKWFNDHEAEFWQMHKEHVEALASQSSTPKIDSLFRFRLRQEIFQRAGI